VTLIHLSRNAVMALGVFLLAACASGSDRHLRLAPDLSGDWSFQVEVAPDRVTHGAMSLAPEGADYTGSLTTDQGDDVLRIRRFTLKGEAVEIIVESPDGDVIFFGDLDQTGRAFNGTVTYHNGQSYPMVAIKS
jgi:hypothetical protein